MIVGVRVVVGMVAVAVAVVLGVVIVVVVVVLGSDVVVIGVASTEAAKRPITATASDFICTMTFILFDSLPSILQGRGCNRTTRSRAHIATQ